MTLCKDEQMDEKTSERSGDRRTRSSLLDANGEKQLERRAVLNPLSELGAFAHMARAALGAGMLSLPQAFMYSGLYFGLIATIIICIPCTYCYHILVRTSRYVCQVNGIDALDYASLARETIKLGPTRLRPYASWGSVLVNVCIFFTQLGFCCVYFVFMAENLHGFFVAQTSINWPVSIWMVVLLPPLLLLCSIRNLNQLAPLSLAANVVYLVGVAICLFYFITHLRPLDSVTSVGKPKDWPLFFGVVMYAFAATSVVLPVENRMARPERFIRWNGALNAASVLVLLIYASIGFLGYLSVGDGVHDTVTLDLPDQIFYQIVKLIFVACVMVSFPVQFYVPIERVEALIEEKVDKKYQLLVSYTVRWAIVLATCAVAELVPHLSLFISLIGSVSITSIGLVFPPIFELIVHYAKNELSVLVWVRNITLLSFALLGFSTGTYSALKALSEVMF